MNEKSKHIYILFTHTHTFSAQLIRLFGRVKYNHCAISLDKECTYLYSFARPEINGLFLGKLVHESIDRYTFHHSKPVKTAVIELPVSEEQFHLIEKRIQEIEADDEYMYNFMSVITYPISGGFSVYKSYSCAEFVASLLKTIDSALDQPSYRYTPDQLLKRYMDYLVYQGDLRDYLSLKDRDEQYFAAMTMSLFLLNLYGIYKILKRCLFSIFIDFI